MSEVLPVEVKGDIAYQLNKTRDGWIIVLMNNKGVIKNRFKPEEFDLSKKAEVQVTFKGTVKRIAELRGGRKIEPRKKGNYTTFNTQVMPGEVRIIRLLTQ